MSKPIQRGILSGFLIAVTCYISVHAQSTTITTTEKTNSTNIQSNQNGFPAYINTGNKTWDDSVYAVSKATWIKEHPDEYKTLTIESNTVTKKNTQEVIEDHILVPFNTIRSYQLIKAEAIAATGTIPTNDELKAETENIKIDFPEKLTWLNIGVQNQIQWVVEKKMDMRGVEKRNSNSIEWFFENKECPSCSKTWYLSIESESDATLIYQLLSEDEHALFSYRLEFVKTK
jgi:hypothetical protein